MNITPIPFNFHGGALDPVVSQGKVWFRSKDIARALGYADEYAVTRIYGRNRDEFSDSMTMVLSVGHESAKGTVNMTAPPVVTPVTGVNEQQTRLFTLRGCHLVGMFAETAKAKEFRRWVLDALDAEAGAEAEAEKEKPDSERQAAAITFPQRVEAGQHLVVLAEKLTKETSPALIEGYHAQYAQLSALLGLPQTPLHEFLSARREKAAAVNGNPREVEDLWEKIRRIDAAPGTKADQSRRPDQTALNLGRLQSASARAGVHLPDKDVLYRLLRKSKSPRYAGSKVIKSVLDGKAVRCLMFEAANWLV